MLVYGHRDILVETACRLCSGSGMRIIYCCPIQLGGEISNYTGFLLPHSFHLPLPSSLPFSLSVLGRCQILTLEAPLITEKTPSMYNGYIYSKDDVRSPFVKPPCVWRGEGGCKAKFQGKGCMDQCCGLRTILSGSDCSGRPDPDQI
jgi:hypothetical protein